MSKSNDIIEDSLYSINNESQLIEMNIVSHHKNLKLVLVLTIPVLLLCLLIANFIIFIINGEKEKIDEEKNLIKAKYLIQDSKKEVKLINSKYTQSDLIESMWINKKKINISDYYIFNSSGNYSIEIIFKKNLNSTSEMFLGCETLKEIDLSQLITKEVGNMTKMFYECFSLNSIKFKENVENNVIDMSFMFFGCSSLEKVELSAFKSTSLESMDFIFYGCNSLKSLDFSSFITSNLKSLIGSFSSCSSLTSINLSSFNTSEIIKMNSLFNGCSSLTSINLKNFDTSKVEDMENMFENCSSLAYIDISLFNTTLLKKANKMFYNITLNGTILIDSSIFDKKKIDTFPNSWEIIDKKSNDSKLHNI